MNQNIIMPGNQIPSFRNHVAFQRGIEKNFLLTTLGGLGDQVCAEPVLRHALKMFDKCDITLASQIPELFTHLKFKEVIDFDTIAKDPTADERYLIFNTIVPPTNLTWEFFSHCLTHPVDFASMCAFRLQLPNKEKEIQLDHGFTPLKPVKAELEDIDWSRACVVHAGRHWPSKTFPKAWWDRVLASLLCRGITPVLIGKLTDDNRGTVDVNAEHCIDLRNKTSIKEMIYVLQKTKVVLTNDSSPLHIAASGDAHIGFVASCKHPDYLYHWRQGQFGWRMKDFSRDGIWNYIDHNPAQENEVKVDLLPSALTYEMILPDPSEFAAYAEAALA